MAIIYGTSGSDTNPTPLVGTSGDDVIYTLEGDDQAYGGDGNDIIDGAAGGDGLYGEGGNDTLIAGDGNDFLYGGAGDDRLEGGAGEDQIHYDVSNSGGSITVNLTTGIASGIDDGNDTLVDVEAVRISNYYSRPTNAHVTGNDANNAVFIPSWGSHTVLTGSGNDAVSMGFDFGSNLDGGAGTDLLRLDRSYEKDGAGLKPAVTPVTLTFSPGGNDTLWEGTSFTRFEYLDLQTGAGNDAVTFNNPLAQTYFEKYLTPLYWASAAFSSSWNAGAGNDTATVNLSTYVDPLEMKGGIIRLAQGPASGFLGSVLSLSNVENYSVTGGSGADNFVTEGGNDTLAGGAGSDFLNGGAGIDAAIYSGNLVEYTLTINSNGSYTVFGPNGGDTVMNIEYLQFADQTIAINSTFNSSVAPMRGDGNADGRTDILWQHDDGRAGMWFMNGTTILGNSDMGIHSLDSSGPIAGTADFNGDGRADILFHDAALFQDGSSYNAIWLMEGGIATYATNGRPWNGAHTGPGWTIVGTGDFDGNGKSDILWQYYNGQTGMWFMDGATILSNPTVGPDPGPTWHIRTVGDVNNDGNDDIIWQHDSGQVGVWLMNGTTMLSNPIVGSNFDANLKIKASGDFDGDGKADLLFQHTNGQVAIWMMDSSTVRSQTNVGSNPGPIWQVKGTADLDGDGKTDVLFQHSGGQAGAWFMSGTTIVSQPYLGANPGTAWHMITSSGN